MASRVLRAFAYFGAVALCLWAPACGLGAPAPTTPAMDLSTPVPACTMVKDIQPGSWIRVSSIVPEDGHVFRTFMSGGTATFSYRLRTQRPLEGHVTVMAALSFDGATELPGTHGSGAYIDRIGQTVDITGTCSASAALGGPIGPACVPGGADGCVSNFVMLYLYEYVPPPANECRTLVEQFVRYRWAWRP